MRSKVQLCLLFGDGWIIAGRGGGGGGGGGGITLKPTH